MSLFLIIKAVLKKSIQTSFSIINNKLHFNPQIPEKWNAFAFNILFRSNQLNIKVEKHRTIISNIKGPAIELYLRKKLIRIESESQEEIER